VQINIGFFVIRVYGDGRMVGSPNFTAIWMNSEFGKRENLRKAVEKNSNFIQAPDSPEREK
jgi:hypothetical protein